MIKEIELSIYESMSEKQLSLDDGFVMMKALYERCMECGINDPILESKVEKLANIVSKPVAKYNEIAGKQAEAIGKIIIKNPDKLKARGKELPEDAYEMYHKNMLKWKLAYKTASVGALEVAAFITPIPFTNTVLTIALSVAMSKSQDPIDKMVMDKLNSMKDDLKDKVSQTKQMISSFKDKIKNKIFKTNGDAKREMDKIEVAASSIAKQSDVLARKINDSSKKSPSKKAIMEGAMSNIALSADEIVLNKSGQMNTRSYNILRKFIEYADYDNPLAHEIVDRYIFE